MRTLENKPFTLAGRGGAALLVHGLGGGPVEVQRLAEALHARTGLTVRAMAMPGHTAPSRRMPGSRHEEWVPAVQEELARLGGDGPVHLCGFSAGGTVSLRVAELGSVTGKLVLLAPFLDVHQPRLLPVKPDTLLDLFTGLRDVPRRGARLVDKALQREVNRLLPFATMNLDAARSAKRLGEIAMREIDQVKVPVLILQGAKDGVVDPRGAERIAAMLPGERRLVVLPESDHLLTLDGERDRVFDEVAAFLRAE
ncbi:MAG: alpha/beta fold hydrolase [Polyangiaceae bacterium]